MLSREYGRRGHHHQLDVGDGHSCPLGLLLRILHHVDELGDAVGLRVILVHVGPETNHVHRMEPPAVGFEESHDLPRRDFRVEGLGVLEVVIPNLLDGFAEEFGNAPFGSLVAGEIISARFMGRFRSDADDGRGIVGDARVVKGEPDWAAEVVATMVGGISRGIGEDCREGMDPPKLIVGDVH